jgi:toxin-antitoxin system PIN domain toxin
LFFGSACGFVINDYYWKCSSSFLEHAIDTGEPLAVSELILAAVVRIATNPTFFKPAAKVETAFEFAEAFRQHPEAAPIAPGPRHWRIFRDLVEEAGVRGSDTTDAYLAALAIEHGCEWWTADADFAKFSGLKWRNVLGGRLDLLRT